MGISRRMASATGDDTGGFWNVMTSLERRLEDMRSPGVPLLANSGRRHSLQEPAKSPTLSARGSLQEALADLDRSRQAAKIAVNSRKDPKRDVMSPIRIPGMRRESEGNAPEGSPPKFNSYSPPAGSLFGGTEAFHRGTRPQSIGVIPKTPGPMSTSPRGECSPRAMGNFGNFTPFGVLSSSPSNGTSALEKLRRAESSGFTPRVEGTPRVDRESFSANPTPKRDLSHVGRPLSFGEAMHRELHRDEPKRMNSFLSSRENSFSDIPTRASSFHLGAELKRESSERAVDSVNRRLEFSGLLGSKESKTEGTKSTSTDYLKRSPPKAFRTPRRDASDQHRATINFPLSRHVSSTIPTTVFSDRSSSTTSGASGSSGFETQTSSSTSASVNADVGSSSSNANGSEAAADVGSSSGTADAPSHKSPRGVSSNASSKSDDGGVGDAGAAPAATSEENGPSLMSRMTEMFWSRMSTNNDKPQGADRDPTPKKETEPRVESAASEQQSEHAGSHAAEKTSPQASAEPSEAAGDKESAQAPKVESDLLREWKLARERAEALAKAHSPSALSSLDRPASVPPRATPPGRRPPAAPASVSLSFTPPPISNASSILPPADSFGSPGSSPSARNSVRPGAQQEDPTQGRSNSNGGVAVAALKHASSLASERAALQRQLCKAEADMERMSRTMDQMRRGHEMQIASVRREKEDLHEALEQHHVAELEGMRLQVSDAFGETHRLHLELVEERRRNEQLGEEVMKRPAPTAEGVAPVIAQLEIESFKDANAEMRAQLKRRLQLKWHPDKCINADLAKCVMQELQRCDDWKS